MHTSLPRTGRPFRIATLEPRSSGELDIVKVSLVQSDLDEKPKFTALSYVWKSPPGQAEIAVNGQKLNRWQAACISV